MSDDLKSNRSADPRDFPQESALGRAFEALVAAGGTGESAAIPGEGTHCPDPGEWLRLTGHETSTAESMALLSHASSCRECLNRFSASRRITAEDVSPDESEELGQFASSSPQWQHRLAVELANSPRPANRRWKPGLLAWAGALAAFTVILVAGLVSWWRYENAPSRLLAEAYTRSRTFDLRVPGAAFAPVIPEQHLRGGTADRESPDLLTARAEIERNLERSPSDPHWLQLEARADLLGEKYDPAIDILDRLLAAGPVTPDLLADDASAYFQRGTATGSENDRATALDYLRRADELAPGDPVILFNEAIVMEDRGQVMNAVETWNRFLKFERDPRWKEDGLRRLKALEQKLDKLQTHSSRMERYLATPQSMRALAADATALSRIDEELSSTLLPKLLDAAFPLPAVRSRGSPCGEKCSAARTLLDALATSLIRNHQDPWLHDFLPSQIPVVSNDYPVAAHELSEAIAADMRGAYPRAAQWALQSRELFHRLGDLAGEDRADVERIYALQRSYTLDACHHAAEALLAQRNQFQWIRADATTLDAGCNMSPGTAAADNPLAERGVDLAQAHHYDLLEMRARNAAAAAAVESGDPETGWRFCIQSLRRFYSGDYPPFRAATIMAGLALIEDKTPRRQLDLLVNRETLELFELSQNRAIIAEQRVALIRAAIRAGALEEAEKQMAIARTSDFAPEKNGLEGIRAESEIAMAGLYLNRRDFGDAAHMLDDARDHMIGEDNSLQLRDYAAERGELELALGHPEAAEPALHSAILEEELQARGAGEENIVFARENRKLYAVLAAVWLAEKRPAIDILALWERYRLRILGEFVPACPASRLNCLKTRLERGLAADFHDPDRGVLIGQIVLRDRVLLYHADAHDVIWSQKPIQQADVMAAADSLERVTSSPATSQKSVDQAASRVGSLLLAGLPNSALQGSLLLLEPDPLLGNIPWAAVETKQGPIGLRFALEEAPSVLLNGVTAGHGDSLQDSSDRPLVIGASDGAGGSILLPEVLKEARTVASLEIDPNMLLARQATEPQVVQKLNSASIIHFAGHAAQFDGATRLLLAPTGSPIDRPYLDKSVLLRNPPRHAKLVVFSACSTGKREAGWNHGMGDIVDTLAYLGVPEVVSTRWQIDSASAVLVMDSFYRGLAAGRTVPQALTAARWALIRDGRWKHPYYWAAYYASGIGNTNVREVFHGNSK